MARQWCPHSGRCTVSLLQTLLRRTVPATVPVPRLAVPAPGLVDDAAVTHLRAQNSRLALEADAARSTARRATARAERAEQLLAELLIAHAGDSTDEVLRLRRALLHLEDLLEGCRRKHGSNTPSGDPLAAHPGVPQ